MNIRERPKANKRRVRRSYIITAKMTTAQKDVIVRELKKMEAQDVKVERDDADISTDAETFSKILSDFLKNKEKNLTTYKNVWLKYKFNV